MQYTIDHIKEGNEEVYLATLTSENGARYTQVRMYKDAWRDLEDGLKVDGRLETRGYGMVLRPAHRSIGYAYKN